MAGTDSTVRRPASQSWPADTDQPTEPNDEPAAAPEAHPLDVLLAGGATAPPARRRHAAPEDAENLADDSSAAAASPADDRPRGRHGGAGDSTGLSAAVLNCPSARLRCCGHRSAVGWQAIIDRGTTDRGAISCGGNHSEAISRGGNESHVGKGRR